MSAYQYEPLSSSDSFRLLLLQPSASRDAELRGSLLNTKLSDCDFDLIDPYTALSYVWGNPEKPCLMVLDGVDFPITRSLHDALCDMRDVTRVRRLWADALCIDQLNIPERNRQVSLMGSIYTTAHNTVIHLGDLTLDAAAVLAATPRLPWKGVSDLGEKHAAEIADHALRDLLSRTWFKRVWVLQELVLSKDPWVQCGEERVRWTDFCRLLLINVKIARIQDSNGYLRVLADMNKSRNNSMRLPLHQAVQARRGLGATDPRDFVFANFGIVSDLPEVGKYLKVDYSRGVEWTFGMVGVYLFDAVGFEKLIAHAVHVPVQQRIKGLPSWAPDWTYPAAQTVPMYTDNHMSHMTVVGTYHTFTDSPLPLVLGHIGYTVDVIKSVSGVVPFFGTWDRSTYVTAVYEHARTELGKIYRNAYSSGDKYGTYEHISLKGKEDEHGALCSNLGRGWTQFVADVCEDSPEEKQFCRFFAGWILAQVSDKRPFVGSPSRGLVHLLHSFFARTVAGSELEGRRLAQTQNGRCGIVPAQTRKGDVVAYVAGSKTAVILRDADTNEKGQIDAAVLEGLRRRVRPELNSASAWYFDIAEDCHHTVEHYSVVGEGYLDGYTGWALKSPPEPSQIRVFALH
ncbi:Heterokaryon incompatibility protein 6, OR allele [Colletotrichum trifolii]|uniref:Heterokaryon incompatibility protein 6, OR allele n=1 Tax=Colletotrichum trifolii TaxID=5466 RepID=A0A4R8RM08_COLTR|nr:Heterokaryon incompatibility protein 6, OR allele [Colletotrichum trifolii]